jgi:hypothetical protein
MSIATEIKRRDDMLLGVTATSIADALLKLGSVNSDSDSCSNASSSSSGRKRNSPSLSSSFSSSPPVTTTHDDDTSTSTIDTIIPTNNKRSRSDYNNNTYHQTTASSTSTIFNPIPRPSLGYYILGGGPPSSSSNHNPKKVVSDDDDEDEGRYFNNARTTTTKFSTNKFPQINIHKNNNKMIPGEIGPIHSSSQFSGFPGPLGAPLGAPPLLPMGIVVEEQELCHPTPFSAPSSVLFSHQQGAPPATATPSMSSAVITQHNDCFIMHSYTILRRNNNNNSNRISLHNLQY